MRQSYSQAARQRYYPWLVIAISFLTVGVAFGARNAFAVFLIAVVEEFHWSRGLASGALMVGSILWTLSAPPIGVLLDRFGPRLVLTVGALTMAAGFVVSGLARDVEEFYLGMGVLVGIGFAALTMTSQATFLSNWFVRKRGMAIGAAAAGIGCGILIVVPLTQRLIAAYGWRAAYFILAAILAVLIAPLNYLFQRRTPEEMQLKADFGETLPEPQGTRPRRNNPSGPSLGEVIKTRRFWMFAVGVLAGAIPLHLVLIHQVAAVSDAGFSRNSAALGLGLIGLFTAPAMIMMGFLADRIGRQWAYLLGSASLMVGILILVILGRAPRDWLLYTFPPFIAFGFSSRQSLYPTMAADLFHGKSFGAIIGAIALFIGAGAGIGPWLGGVMHDATGGYHLAFVLAEGLAFASIILIWLAGAKNE